MQKDYLPIVSIIFRTPEECDFSPLTLPFLKACKEQHNVLCLFLNNQRTEYQGTNSHIFVNFRTLCKKEVRTEEAGSPLSLTS